MQKCLHLSGTGPGVSGVEVASTRTWRENTMDEHNVVAVYRSRADAEMARDRLIVHSAAARRLARQAGEAGGA